MGNCDTDENPAFRKINHSYSFFLNNPFNEEKYNSNKINNKNNFPLNNDFNMNNSQSVYRISRKRKMFSKKIKKLDYYNIVPIKNNNNTNNSTTSKSKNTTDLSDINNIPRNNSIYSINSDKYSIIKTLESEKSLCSSQINNFNSKNTLKKK